jgi:RimJ/RimL family protein N-acetyltransferase
MENIHMENAFRSAQLVYRAIEDDETDKKFFHEHIQKDPVTFALSDLRHFRPQSQKDSEDIFKLFQKCMIAVVICLPAEHDTTRPQIENEKSDSNEGAREEPKPTPIGLAFLIGHPSPARFQHRSASLAITLTKTYQGKGYGSEAMNWILDWAFMHGNLHSVNLRTFSFNTQAIRAYEKVGFVKDGRQRESIWFNREWHDELIFSMLESDWEMLRGKGEDGIC